jgi:hypothetical protein
VRTVTNLEPAPAPEEGEQDCERHELGADAEADERLPAADAPDQIAEVLAEEAGEPGQRPEGAVVSVNGDEEALGVDAVHLDEGVLVR